MKDDGQRAHDPDEHVQAQPPGERLVCGRRICGAVYPAAVTLIACHQQKLIGQPQNETEHLLAALQAAEVAFSLWSVMSARDRAQIMHRAMDIFRSHLDEYARLLTQEHGKPLNDANATAAGVAAVDGARPLAKNAYKVPLTQAVVKRALLALA